MNISPGKTTFMTSVPRPILLKRNINYCPTHIKSNCYKTFVRPILEYESPIWAPHQQKNISALEKVQLYCRQIATQWITTLGEAPSVTTMLYSLDWPILESRRLYSKLVMVYKIINVYIEVPSLSLIPIHTSTRGHSQRFRPPYASCSTYLYSFVPSSTIKLWNNLPENIVNQPSLSNFKESL